MHSPSLFYLLAQVCLLLESALTVVNKLGYENFADEMCPGKNQCCTSVECSATLLVSLGVFVVHNSSENVII